MKRILLFLLFAVSFTAFAQVQIPQEYTIQKPLRLGTVNPGTKSDSVLVRGNDKIIKFVPQSSLNGGSTLDQTLTNGNTSGQFIVLTGGPGGASVATHSGGGFTCSNTAGGPVSRVWQGEISVAASEFSSDKSIMYKDGFAIRVPRTGLENKIETLPITGNWIAKLQNKSGTIAYLDDILGGSHDLQKTLDIGGMYSYVDGEKNISLNIGQFSGGFGIETTLPEMSTSMYANYGTVGISAYHFLTDVGWSMSSGLPDQGRFKLESFGPSGTTILEFEDPVLNSVNTKIKIPSKKVPGDYILATTSDLAIDNQTVTNLSLTDLNTTYPNAINGYRVHCPSISTGALIYEKTQTGWLEISVSIVYNPQ